MFLEDQIEAKKDEMAGKSKEEANKRKDGMVKIRAIDPMDGNKIKTMWVKKDDATKSYEAQAAKENSLEKREAAIAHKEKMLDLAKKEKEIASKEKEITAMEKSLLKESE